MGHSASAPRPDELPEDDRNRVLGGKPTLNAVAERILDGRIKNIVVLAGAGISVAAGIPDFRSPGSGLYSNLAKYNLPKPESVFDIEYFRARPQPFFQLAKELYPGKFVPTPTHYFLKLLADKGLLRRIYTQNIDTLERIAGIPEDLLVEVHGSFQTATCIECFVRYTKQFVKAAVFADKIPKCTRCGGVVKPDITFFGERLPHRFSELVDTDCKRADLLLVIGTSLQVMPVNSIPSKVGAFCPRVLLNREAVAQYEADDDDEGDGLFGPMRTFRFALADNYRDVFVEGDCDDGVARFAKALGFKDELRHLVEAGQSQVRAQQEAEEKAAQAEAEARAQADAQAQAEAKVQADARVAVAAEAAAAKPSRAMISTSVSVGTSTEEAAEERVIVARPRGPDGTIIATTSTTATQMWDARSNQQHEYRGFRAEVDAAAAADEDNVFAPIEDDTHLFD